jgi:aspartyl-tRNA(Asn)/glutamyl-tRNA(Gln) amidotransferase subunit A
MDDPIDVMRPLWSVAIATALSSMDEADRALVDSPLLSLAEEGRSLDAVAMRKLETRREDISRKLTGLHRDYDLLVTPQVAITPFAAGMECPADSGYERWWEWSPYTYPYNMSGQPCATLPCGFTSTGLPVACQLVGDRFDDARLLQVALAYERASGRDTVALDFSTVVGA